MKVAEGQGFETAAIDYTKCKNANERIARLKDFMDSKDVVTLVLVGSSMGGYISAVVANDYRLPGLFLMCPALYMSHPEYTVQD